MSLLRGSPRQSSGWAGVVGAVLAPHALVAGPGLDEGAVHTEVLAREQPPPLGHLHRRVEQLRDRIVLDQPVTVLAEDRVVPDGVLDGQTDKPAKQQVVLDLLHQLPLAANAVEHLQQHRTHELLGGDARSATSDVSLVHGGELDIHPRQRVIDPGTDRPQRVTRRNKVLEPHCREQRFVVSIGSAHRGLARSASVHRSSSTTRGESIGISTAC